MSMRSRPAGFFRRLMRNRLARTGGILLACVLAIAVIGPMVASGDPNAMMPRLRNLPPSFAHPFGTDQLGRDLLLRTVFGSRLSLSIALAISLLSLVLGAALGMVAGYAGGWIDGLISRIMDSLMAFPSILLALGIMAMLGATTTNVIVALTLVYMPRVARVARAPVMSQKSLEYVEAARAGGASHLRLIFRHILPNVTSPIIVQATVVFAYAMVAEAALGFLGIGVPPPQPTWGNLLADARRTLTSAPMQTVFPALALGLTVLGVNLFGDGLRDVLDPRMRGHGGDP